MFAQPSRGRAWFGCPKPRRRSWLRKQSAQALPALDDTRAYRPAARGGLSCRGRANASGETPERRLWAFQREDRRAPARRTKWLFLSVSNGLPQGRTGPGEEAIHPGAFTSGVVVFTDRLTRLGLNRQDRRAAC